MNFMEAVKAMKDGKEVRRKKWKESIKLKAWEYRELVFNCICENITIIDIEATDWEIVNPVK